MARHGKRNRTRGKSSGPTEQLRTLSMAGTGTTDGVLAVVGQQAVAPSFWHVLGVKQRAFASRPVLGGHVQSLPVTKFVLGADVLALKRRVVQHAAIAKGDALVIGARTFTVSQVSGDDTGMINTLWLAEQ